MVTKVKTVTDDGTPIAYYVKGHIDFDSLKLGLVEQTDLIFDDIKSLTPYYAWLRNNPCNDGMYTHYVDDGEPGTRGCFPATVVEVSQTFRSGRSLYKKYDRMPEPVTKEKKKA